MSEDTFNEGRLLRLEEKVAYQDKIIAELNDVVVTLNQSTNELKGRLERIERLMRSEFGSREMPNEKPPHY